MAQKAKLDILDIPLDGVPPPEVIPREPSGDGEPVAARAAWCRRPWFLAGGLAVLAALAAAVVLLLWSPPERPGRPGKEDLVAAGVPASVAATGAVVEEYYVDLRDASGKPRLAVVGLVLEPAEGSAAAELNGPEVRRAVHAILSGKTAEDLRTSKEREGLRKELAGGINGVLKRDAVRTVWFSDLNVW